MERLDPPVPFGRYALTARIATGGMAEIFKAELLGIEGFAKTLALKRILPFWSERKEFVTMLVDEAKVLVHLNHPNIVQVYELGKVGESYFIAMEYVEGGDLRQLTRQLANRGETLPQDLAITIVLEALHGLHYAHHRSVEQSGPLDLIHRDVSPQNILLSTSGEVKVTDFGIAKAVTQSHETQTGVLKGKYAYMAPEQALGKALDQRSDLFAMGIVLWELLFGERLFATNNDMHTLSKVREAEVFFPEDKLKSLYPGLQQVLLRALAKNKDERFATADDFAEALESCLPSGHRVRQSTRANFFRKIFTQPQVAKETENAAAPNSGATQGLSRPRKNLVNQDLDKSVAEDIRQTLISPLNEEPTTSLAVSKSLSQVSLTVMQVPSTHKPKSLWVKAVPVILLVVWVGLALMMTRLTWVEFFSKSEEAKLNQAQEEESMAPPSDLAPSTPVGKVKTRPEAEPKEPPAPKIRYGSLQLKATPAQAKLVAQWPGGEKKSQGSLQLSELAEGTTVSVTATLSGYHSQQKTYLLAGEQLNRQESLNLVKQAPQFGSLVIQSVPWAYATVPGYVGGAQTPVSRSKVKVGSYPIRLRSEVLGKHLSGRAKIRAQRKTVCVANWAQNRLACK